ncbi:MAG TPA: DUF364 domain-containing protein [Thermoplasmata archaeon]|nr:DUF364 domain-containing protein [Thermoplasmata archaeon]
MKLVDEIIASVEPEPATDIRVGLKYTAVEVKEKIGLAYNFSDSIMPPLKNAGSLIGKDLIKLSKSWNFIEASIGCAAINALLKPKVFKKMNIFDHILEISKDYKRVGIVGRFPFIGKIRGREVFVFEKKPMEGALPDTAEEELLPKCDLVVISGSTFVNKSLQRLLELSNGHTLVIGPTTPLTPILFDHGADLIAGVVAKDKKALEIVSQGGGTQEFSRVVDEVVMKTK